MNTVSKEVFLRAVLPELNEGEYYCSFFMKKIEATEKIIQHFHTTIEALIADTTIHPDKDLWNTHYLIGVTTSRVRRKEFMSRHKAFFVDVDLKEYKDKAQAWAALQKFFTTLELPMPTLVDSGNGLHAYWILDAAIPTYQWVRIAEHFKAMCIANKFHADHNCTADASRALRVPDTINIKDPFNPKMVVCAVLSPPMTLDLFTACIGYSDAESYDGLDSPNYGQLVDPIGQAIFNTQTAYKSFRHGLSISLQGLGCEFIAIAYRQQALLDEPQWRSVLSIAQHCADRDKAIHVISRNHAGYTPGETEKKASLTSAPHTCEMFRNVFCVSHPDMKRTESGKPWCDTCKIAKTVKSPISVCISQQEARPEDNIITTIDASTGSRVTVSIPAESYPFPYHRGQEGGVFKKARIDALEGETPTLQEMQGKNIYPYDLWVDSLQVDPAQGEIVVICLKQPREPLKRFSVPLRVVTAVSEFTDVMSFHGISAPNYKELMEYIKAYVNKLQMTTDKIMCPASFGWDDDMSSFVLGNKRYMNTGEVEFCLPSKSVEYAASIYGMRSLDKVTGASEEDKINRMLATWQNIFKIHQRPGQEARLFATFVSIGSPLFSFFENIESVILHLTNKDSGVGKSTLQHFANSVWGRPSKEALMNISDTKLSIFQHLGVLRNVVMCVDELTTIEPQRLCQFCFDVTNGRGRHRMESHSNALRANETSWHVPIITSGNNGLHQLMTQYKLVADGEAMRVLEMPVLADVELQTPENKELTDKLFSTDLMNSYGVVGDILLKYYVTHANECRDELMATRVRFDRLTEMTQRERFYSALFASALTGGAISKRLGIHNTDMEVFEQWCVRFCQEAAETAKGNRIPLNEQFAEFLHDMTPNTLITSKIGRNLQIIQSAVGNIAHVRYARDANRMYINQSQLKKWCNEKGVMYTNMTALLKNEHGGEMTTIQLDLHSGVKVRVIRIDTHTITLGNDND